MSGTNIVYDATSNTWYSTLSAAITGSSANDVLLIAGSFVENFPTITHSLTIEAVSPNLASLSNPQPLPPNTRAVLDCPFEAGVNLTISGLNIFGANNNSIGIDNGAGILFEVGNGVLTVNHSWIHDNEDGILTGGPNTFSPGGTMSVSISDSEIDDNGLQPGDPRYGLDHNLYIGDVNQFTITGSYIHGALGGHEIKSRALASTITDNRIEDGPTAPTSYGIDMANAGVDIVTGNLIEKGPDAVQQTFIHFGGDSPNYPASSLLISNNTIIDDRFGGGILLSNASTDPNAGDPNYGHNVPATISGNTIHEGSGGPVTLFSDANPPPPDNASSNVFLTSADPVLDTASPNLPRLLRWSGAAKDGSLGNAANWTDLTDGLNPAADAPGPMDTVAFSSVGGTLANQTTVSAAGFSGFDIWTIGSASVFDAFGSGVTIGAAAGTSLMIDAGGTLGTFGDGDVVAAVTGDAGMVDVDGAGANWTAYSAVTVGAGGTGRVAVQSGGTLISRGTQFAAVLGSNAGARGTLLVSGAGSRAVLNGQVNVGAAGAGVLDVADQGTVTTGGAALTPSQGIDVSGQAGGAGQIDISGTASLLENTGAFVVGDAAPGSLSIANGGTVVANPGPTTGLAGLLIANTAGASGSSVDLTGNGSFLNDTGLLDVGAVGSGALEVTAGATVEAGSLDVGASAAAVGQLDLSGAGTKLTVANAATVADAGTGVLSVLSGATFAAGSLTIGAQSGGSGAVLVSGANSLISLSGALNVGTALGAGELTVGPGADIEAAVVNLYGAVVLDGGLLDPVIQLIGQGHTVTGDGTISADDIIDEGAIAAGGATPSRKLLVVNGDVLGGGGLTVNGVFAAGGGPGLLAINPGGTLELTGAVLNATETTLTDNLPPAGTYTVTNSVVDVDFADGTGVLKLDDIGAFAGTIAAWQPGDSIVISGGTLSDLALSGYAQANPALADPPLADSPLANSPLANPPLANPPLDNLPLANAPLANPVVSNGDTLTVSDRGGTDTLIFASPIDAGSFAIINGNTLQAEAGGSAQLACFAAGTRIATETGWTAVEVLALGEPVLTEDGECEPVVWLGTRSVNCRSHPQPRTVWPVRVRAGTFGPDRPAYDLFLSPDHAVFVNGALVPVKLLINGTSIAQAQREHVRYFHVELPRHAIILAEGLPVESYLDTGDRANFAHGGATIRLFPDFTTRLSPAAAMIWETRGAAPLVMTGERLAAARLAVDERVFRRHARGD